MVAVDLGGGIMDLLVRASPCGHSCGIFREDGCSRCSSVRRGAGAGGAARAWGTEAEGGEAPEQGEEAAAVRDQEDQEEEGRSQG